MDRDELIRIIDDSGISKKKIAEVLGITPQGLANKLNGDSEFKVSEAKLIGELLRMDDAEIVRVFLP